MRCLVLFYAYDGDPEQVDPIAILSDETLGNLDLDDVEEAWRQARAAYGADPSECRTAWVEMPDAGHLFVTPDLGAAVEVPRGE